MGGGINYPPPPHKLSTLSFYPPLMYPLDCPPPPPYVLKTAPPPSPPRPTFFTILPKNVSLCWMIGQVSQVRSKLGRSGQLIGALVPHK